MTFNSVYEITNNLSTIAGQHMIDYFSGNSLDDRWTLQNNTALPTVAMQDSVDGGLLMTNTGAGGGGSICFNGIKQYANPCSCIMVIKNTTADVTGSSRSGAAGNVTTK